MHILFIWRKHYLYAPFEAARDFLASSRWLSVTFYWGVSGFISRLFLIRHVLILKILWINFWNGKQTSVLSAIKWLVKTNIAFDRLCHQIELITSWLLHTVCALLLELYCTFQTCELSMLLARKSAESKWKQGVRERPWVHTSLWVHNTVSKQFKVFLRSLSAFLGDSYLFLRCIQLCNCEMLQSASVTEG